MHRSVNRDHWITLGAYAAFVAVGFAFVLIWTHLVFGQWDRPAHERPGPPALSPPTAIEPGPVTPRGGEYAPLESAGRTWSL